jgi:hypothetical protein
LRGIRYREGKKTKIYLRNPPGSSPKGYVTETDRQRGIKTYKGTVVMMKALNNDPHTGSLASGNLSTDNNLKRKVDAVLGEIEKLPVLTQHFPQYGRSTAFQSPPDNTIYTDRQNDISGQSNNMNKYNSNYFQSPNEWVSGPMNKYNSNYFQSPNEWVSGPSNDMNNNININTNKHSSKFSILNLG